MTVIDSFYLRTDVAGNVDFAGRLVVERYSALLSPGNYK